MSLGTSDAASTGGGDAWEPVEVERTDDERSCSREPVVLGTLEVMSVETQQQFVHY